jgi:hypothetical protein
MVVVSKHGIPYSVERIPSQTNKRPKVWNCVYYNNTGKRQKSYLTKKDAVHFMESLNPNEVNTNIANRDHSSFHIYWDWG